MPDTPIEPPGGGRYPADMESPVDLRPCSGAYGAMMGVMAHGFHWL